MVGRVCLRLRIPFALSDPKFLNRFSLVPFCCPCRLFYQKDDTFIVFATKSPVAACFGLRWFFFQIRNKNKKQKKACLVGKLYFCNAHPRGKEFRGAADKILFGALRFYLFGCIKNRKK